MPLQNADDQTEPTDGSSQPAGGGAMTGQPQGATPAQPDEGPGGDGVTRVSGTDDGMPDSDIDTKSGGGNAETSGSTGQSTASSTGAADNGQAGQSDQTDTSSGQSGAGNAGMSGDAGQSDAAPDRAAAESHSWQDDQDGSSSEGEISGNIDAETATALNLQSDGQWSDEEPEWDESSSEAASSLGLGVDVDLGLSLNTSSQTSDDGGFDMGG